MGSSKFLLYFYTFRKIILMSEGFDLKVIVGRKNTIFNLHLKSTCIIFKNKFQITSIISYLNYESCF